MKKRKLAGAGFTSLALALAVGVAGVIGSNKFSADTAESVIAATNTFSIAIWISAALILISMFCFFAAVQSSDKN